MGKESVCQQTKQGRNTQKGKKLEVCHLSKNLLQSARMTEKATAVIETSTPCGSVGIFDGAWRQSTFSSDRSTNCAIFAPWQEISDSLAPGDLGLILVGTGPGSYSGTRVGLAVAQGLAIAHDCSLVGIPSVLGTIPARSLPKCRVIGDARRGDWWWWDFTDGCGDPAPTMGSKEQLADLLADGVPTFSLEVIPEQTFARAIPQETPDAKLLWQAWQECSVAEKERLTAQVAQPVYLKPPHITAAKPGHPLLRGR